MTKVNEVDRSTGGCRVARSCIKTGPQIDADRFFWGRATTAQGRTHFSPSLTKTAPPSPREKESGETKKGK
jgi:hypothetical protein